MPLTEERKNLLQMAVSSESLSISTKEMISRDIEHLNDDQIGRLTDILVQEKKRLQAIDQQYQEKEVPIKKQYLEELQNFQHSGMREALTAWEKTEEGAKETDLKHLLEGLEEKKEQPGKKFPLLWLVMTVIVAAGLLYYFFVYGKTA